ncbi:MAG TPA: DUF362 domain-containing protein [Chitinispirillaceae bacterium]|nr:DUF362 domain-containing protein [Chitinispirillaceae bacterium]
MNSKVYFTPVKESDSVEVIKEKLSSLINKHAVFESGMGDLKKVVIKIHFGEEGNTGYLRPEIVAVVCGKITSQGGEVIISDSNTLYRGKRMNSNDHLALAYEHGFRKEITGGTTVIADETSDNVATIPINLQFIKDAKIPKLYIGTDLFISMAHFKGHLAAEFGGTLKNIGMGCATREGKMAQHSDLEPKINAYRCIGCGTCVDKCQVHALSLVQGKAKINAAKCTGCAGCIAVCPAEAIDVNWGSGAARMQEKMVEYAFAVLKNVPRSLHINFATKITAECDCIAKDDPRITDDIGIFISEDPVALDQACFDAVIKQAGKDLFKEYHPHCDGNRQLMYAERLGLGSRKYEVIVV